MRPAEVRPRKREYAVGRWRKPYRSPGQVRAGLLWTPSNGSRVHTIAQSAKYASMEGEPLRDHSAGSHHPRHLRHSIEPDPTPQVGEERRADPEMHLGSVYVSDPGDWSRITIKQLRFGTVQDWGQIWDRMLATCGCGLSGWRTARLETHAASAILQSAMMTHRL